MKETISKSETIKIYIAGNEQNIKDCCKEFCNNIGFCVAVSESDYIYSFGSETGFEITIINYARFPSNYNDLLEKAISLARFLVASAYQRSCSIVTSKESIWLHHEN